MWIFTETGFISAVRTKQDQTLITIRARDHESLEGIAHLAGESIKRSPNGDYPYRVFVSEADFTKWLLESAAKLNYPNFKSRVAQTRGNKFVSALHNVWAVMHEVEDLEARVEVHNEQAFTEDQPKLNTIKTKFGHELPEVSEGDPRIVAYLWEAHDPETGDPMWGNLLADEREGAPYDFPFQVEDIHFYPLTELPNDLKKEGE